MTYNEQLFDALVRHQIFLMRYAAEVRTQIDTLLQQSDLELRDKIMGRLRSGAGSRYELERIQRMQAILAQLRTKSWRQITPKWVRSMEQLATAEPELMSRMVATVSPVTVVTIMPSANLLATIATAVPFEGATLSSWAKRVEEADLARIMNQVQLGMIQGEGAAQIARRVVGTVQMKGLDGVTAVTRRNAEAITRTAVNHVSNQARSAWMQSNADLFEWEAFVATLDSRTTPVCRAEDGERYRPGQGPIPPLHWNCRSTRVPVFGDQLIGNRPFKAVTEKQLLSEYTSTNGLRSVSKRTSLPFGHKGKYDTWARGQLRENIGTVPAKTTYQEWLSRQSAEFQDDVLGPTRAKLFRDGGLTLKKFVNRTGDQIPLSELAVKHADAFRAAGLEDMY